MTAAETPTVPEGTRKSVRQDRKRKQQSKEKSEVPAEVVADTSRTSIRSDSKQRFRAILPKPGNWDVGYIGCTRS